MELGDVLSASDRYILSLILDFGGCLVDLVEGALNESVRDASFTDFLVANENALPSKVGLLFHVRGCPRFLPPLLCHIITTF